MATIVSTKPLCVLATSGDKRGYSYQPISRVVRSIGYNANLNMGEVGAMT